MTSYIFYLVMMTCANEECTEGKIYIADVFKSAEFFDALDDCKKARDAGRNWQTIQGHNEGYEIVCRDPEELARMGISAPVNQPTETLFPPTAG